MDGCLTQDFEAAPDYEWNVLNHPTSLIKPLALRERKDTANYTQPLSTTCLRAQEKHAWLGVIRRCATSPFDFGIVI